MKDGGKDGIWEYFNKDGSLKKAITYENGKVFGFQGHPEASPGPQDIRKLFDKFLQNMST